MYVYVCIHVHVLYAYSHMLVFHSQAIFLAYVLFRNKGSGNHFKLFLVFPCYKICKIKGMLNSDDKAKEPMIFWGEKNLQNNYIPFVEVLPLKYLLKAFMVLFKYFKYSAEDL